MFANSIEENRDTAVMDYICFLNHASNLGFFILSNIFAFYTIQVTKNCHKSVFNFGFCIFWFFEWKYVVYQENSGSFHNALLSLFTSICSLSNVIILKCRIFLKLRHLHTSSIVIRITIFHHSPWSIWSLAGFTRIWGDCSFKVSYCSCLFLVRHYVVYLLSQ